MLKKGWPAVRHNLCLMQDGATCHTTENNLSILKEEFSGRIISNKTDEVWPSNIPDLNSLDRLLFLGLHYAENH